MEALGVVPKLTAILRTNVAGDELTTTLVEGFRGHVVDAAGPILLAEFARVVDAVECAAVIQKVLKVRNERLPLDRRLPFRIGIELGVTGGRHVVSPNGHTLAGRLEALADPGEICIAGDAYDQMQSERRLAHRGVTTPAEGFGEALRVYRAATPARPLHAMDPLPAPLAFDNDASEMLAASAPRWWRRRAAVAALALIVVGTVGGFAVWQLIGPAPSPLIAPSVRPSLAMLPIVNVSGDPGGEGVAAAVDAGVRATLARLSGLTMGVASADVRYVLDGSVRRVDGHVRLIATLVDTLTGHAMGKDPFDRPVADVALAQNDLVQWIIAALSIPVTADEQVTRAAAPAAASTPAVPPAARTVSTSAGAAPAANALATSAVAAPPAKPANRPAPRPPRAANAEPPPATVLEHPRESPAASPPAHETIAPVAPARDDAPRVAPRPPAVDPTPRTPPARSSPPATGREIPYQAN